MNVRLLRQFVSCVLAEGPVAPAAAAHEGLALFSVLEEGAIHLVLYNAKFYLDLITDVVNEGEFSSLEELVAEALSTLRVQRGMVGYLSAFPPNKKEGKCWGAYQVGNAAAEKGYGPMLYDIMMSRVGKLTSDRVLVSPAAQNVWKKYLGRSDVEKQPFDDITKKLTPPIEDDCAYQDFDELNYAYSVKTVTNATQLENNHREFIKDLSKLVKRAGGKIKKDDVETILYRCADKYFMDKYSQSH